MGSFGKAKVSCGRFLLVAEVKFISVAVWRLWEKMRAERKILNAVSRVEERHRQLEGRMARVEMENEERRRLEAERRRQRRGYLARDGDQTVLRTDYMLYPVRKAVQRFRFNYPYINEEWNKTEQEVYRRLGAIGVNCGLCGTLNRDVNGRTSHVYKLHRRLPMAMYHDQVFNKYKAMRW